jgi:tetratricopeptide (TPR) repeat protein
MWSIAAMPLLLSATLPGREARQKAEYYYMSGLCAADTVSDHAGFNDRRGVMMVRAYALDSTLTDAGYLAAGEMIPGMGNDTAAVRPFLTMLERHFAGHPADAYVGANLANIYIYSYRNTGGELKVLRTLSETNPENSDVLVRRATMEQQFGSADSALALYDRVERIDGNSLQLTARRLQCLHSKADTAGMLQLTSRTRREMPQSASARVLSATVFSVFDMNDSAGAMVEEALELDPNNVDAHRYRLAEYADEGSVESYMKEMHSIIEIDEIDYADRLSMVTGIYDYIEPVDSMDCYAEMIELLHHLVAHNPGEQKGYAYLAAAYISSEKPEKAAEVLHEAGVIDPKNFRDRQMEIACWSESGRYDMAYSEASKAVELFPDDVTFAMMQGNAAVALGKTDEAIDIFNKALEHFQSDKDRSSIYCSLGDLYHEQGQAATAFDFYEKSLAANADNALTLNNYAYFMALDGGDLDRAKKMAERANMLNPDSPTVLDTYAWVMFLKKDYATALELINSAMGSISDYSNLSDEMLQHAGDIYFMAGHTEEAIEFWEMGLSVNPQNRELQRKVKNRTI